MRTIHLHQLAKAGFTLAPLAMLLSAALDGPQPFTQQPPAQGLMVHSETFTLQMLSGQCGPKVGIALLIPLNNPLAHFRIGLPITGPATALMHQTGIALLAITTPNPLQLAIAEPQQRCRCHQTQPLGFNLFHHTHTGPFLLTHY